MILLNIKRFSTWLLKGQKYIAQMHIFHKILMLNRKVKINLVYQFSKMAKRQKNENKLDDDWTWSEESLCIYGSSKGVKSSEKIASFDMDDTIVLRKSGAKFPKDAHDWIFWKPQVPTKIKQDYEKGYKIVIFTNQKGVETGQTKIQDIKLKVKNLAKEMKIEMQVFIATSDDQYRKPGIKMWDLLERNNNGIKIDKSKSFFCGDAAGRKNGKVKDFSDSDLKFALNVGVEFKTPENYFLGGDEKVEVKGFNPNSISQAGEVIVGKGDKADFVQKQMIIFVGSPGSGKSTFHKNYLQKYERVNRDTLKTKEKCYKVAEGYIKEGKSVVIDNTNPKKQDRKYFLDLAKKYNYKVRCFEFLTEKDVCFHNDYQRVANDKRNHLSGKAGSIPIHSFFKYKQPPTLDEGYYEINRVNFVAKFESEADKQFYKKFSKK